MCRETLYFFTGLTSHTHINVTISALVLESFPPRRNGRATSTTWSNRH
jgi:hypothetical protein